MFECNIHPKCSIDKRVTSIKVYLSNEHAQIKWNNGDDKMASQIRTHQIIEKLCTFFPYAESSQREWNEKVLILKGNEEMTNFNFGQKEKENVINSFSDELKS